MKKATYFSSTIGFIALMIIFVSCTEEEAIIVDPVIETGNSTDVGLTEVTIEVFIPEVGSREILEYGVKYGEDIDQMKSLKVGTTPSDKSFKVKLTDLYAGTPYFYQAYIKLATTNGNDATTGRMAQFITRLPEIHKVTPSEFVFPGDTVLLEGLFFDDSSKAVVRVRNYEEFIVEGSDFIMHTRDSVKFIFPEGGNEGVIIKYTQKNGTSNSAAEYRGLVFPFPLVTNVYPSIVYDTQTVITVEANYFNPHIYRNRIKTEGSNQSFKIVGSNRSNALELTIPEDFFDDPEISSCKGKIIISNGGNYFTRSDFNITFGIRYEIESLNGSAIETVKSGDTIVFKVDKRRNLKPSLLKFVFSNLDGDYLEKRTTEEHDLFLVQVPKNLSLGKTQIELSSYCNPTTTDSNTEVEVIE